MAVSAVNPLYSDTTATVAAKDDPGSADRFLKLLVTQIQNQDPLNPMDNAQVTSQMAQISTVSGIAKLNTTVQGLSTQFVQLQALQSASLVGRDVVVPGNKLDINASAVGQGGYELAGPADQVTVEVLTPSGQVVDTLRLGAQSSGVHGFDWVAGSATNDAGLRFKVTATTGATTTTATALMRDRVDAVSTAGNSVNLELQNSGTVAYSAVRAFN